MSSWTGTKTGTTESPMAIHHLVTSGFTSKNIQTIDKMHHTVTIDTVVFGNRTYICSQRTADIALLFLKCHTFQN